MIVIFLSCRRYLAGEHVCLLAIRHIVGVIVGTVDQILMILFCFQRYFYAEIFIFDYLIYTLWYLLFPYMDEPDRIKIAKWLIISVIVSTVFEQISLRIITFFLYDKSFIPYPTEPIRWTIIHTVLFYFFIHGLALFIIFSIRRMKPTCGLP